MNNNPNWIRMIMASLILATLLKMALSVPFLSSFLFIGIIYVMHVVRTEMAGGASVAWDTVKLAVNVGIAVVIFVVLRYIAGDLLGFYPDDSLAENDGAGGFWGQLGSDGFKDKVMWEILFALVAGGLAFMFSMGKKRGLVVAILVVSFIVLNVKLAWPNYAETFPSRTEIDSTLAEKKLWGTVKAAVGIGEEKPLHYPSEGNGVATAQKPLAVFLNPSMTYTRVSGPGHARYVSKRDPRVSILIEYGPGDPGFGPQQAKWAKMPWGDYYVYPVRTDSLIFSWWQ